MKKHNIRWPKKEPRGLYSSGLDLCFQNINRSYCVQYLQASILLRDSLVPQLTDAKRALSP